MGADRKKYVMSVEMAMQREMAFRKKLDNLKAEQCSNSTVIIPQRYPLHSQVQSSSITQIPTTTPTPGLNQIPCRPTQVTIPNPRPATYIAPTPAHAPPHRPNLSRARPPSYRPNPPRPGIIRPSRPAYQPPIHFQAKRRKVHSPKDFYCDMCKIDCTSEFNLRMHLKGRNHKTILGNLQAKKVLGGTSMSEANVKQLFCELCGIWCTDANAFTLHLNGKNHILKLHASEMKRKGPVGATSMS